MRFPYLQDAHVTQFVTGIEKNFRVTAKLASIPVRRAQGEQMPVRPRLFHCPREGSVR